MNSGGLSRDCLSAQVLTPEDESKYSSWFHCRFPLAEWDFGKPRRHHRRVWRELYAAKDGHGWLRADGIRRWMMGVVARALEGFRPENHEETKDLAGVKQTRSGKFGLD